MAPHQEQRRSGDDHSGSSRKLEDEVSRMPSTITMVPSTLIPMETPTPTLVDDNPFMTESYTAKSPWSTKKYGWPHSEYTEVSSSVPWANWLPTASSSSTLTFITRTKTPYEDSWSFQMSRSTPTSVATKKESLPSSTPVDTTGGERPDWWNKHRSSGPMYAAASIVPIVVLAIIGGLVFLCLRRRKRQRQATGAAQSQEMKMQPQPTARPYMAPPPATSPQYAVSTQYATSLSGTAPAPQPIILGPIPSGSNGAYFTGIDTSDVVSVTSNTLRPVEHFTDSSSMSEPPPPYRPRSAAPPSFMSTSRQSSVRTSVPPPATSQTHLIGRSPFEDPREDDAISELSSPTIGRSEDNMSFVSDLSYQRDPVVGRTHL